jgi:RNA polymerase sigma-70 factor, ECF subfamily
MSSILRDHYYPSEKRSAYHKEKTDHELLQALADDDMSAFDLLVERYERPIVNYISRMLSDYDRAQDLTQETFLRVYLNCKRYQFISTFSSWIYKIATNLALNELRRRKKVRFLPLIFRSNRDDGQETKVKEVEDVVSPGPDDNLERKQFNEVLNREIQELPVRYRTPLVLRDIQYLSYLEITEITNLPIGTVKSRINRARRILRKRLEPFL